MRCLSFFAAIITALSSVGCATTTRERAVSIALEEVAHRKLPLPEIYTVHVGELIAAVEFSPSYKLWRVDLGVPGRKEPLYRLTIHQSKGTVSDFTDCRAQEKPQSAL